jgi:hypothetical protein
MRLTKSMKLIGLLGLLLVVSAAAPSFERGETGQVRKVLDGDSFVLDSGLEVRLAVSGPLTFGVHGPRRT